MRGQSSAPAQAHYTRTDSAGPILDSKLRGALRLFFVLVKRKWQAQLTAELPNLSL